MTKRLLSMAVAAVAATSAVPALAEFELSAYTGYQTAPHSVVEGNDPGGVGKFDFTAGWEGKSSAMPPYYGFRGTWWRSDTLGYGVEFNHAKVYSDDGTRRDNGFETLEFTDGLNILTANVMRRFPSESRSWTPYAGGGLGVSIPHVEVTTSGGKTFNYQLAGPAVTWVAGVKYPLTDTWSVFGEYKGTYSMNKVDLDNGGDLETNIVTNALNVGVSFSF
ncbi:MAG: outer membrane beta-barrel protein [Rhodobacteraceae bacterium]|nr:outer membrane beta-barrel protein [Paracoccaceae bacterium]